MQLCQDKASVRFIASAKGLVQVSLHCPRQEVCPLPGADPLLSLGRTDGQQANEGLGCIFRLEKPTLHLHDLLDEWKMLRFCNQSQERTGFSDSWQSQLLHWWVLGIQKWNKSYEDFTFSLLSTFSRYDQGKALLKTECWNSKLLCLVCIKASCALSKSADVLFQWFFLIEKAKYTASYSGLLVHQLNRLTLHPAFCSGHCRQCI